jgi:hypothetical protein
MKEITQNGIDYVLIPKKEYEEGKFLNKLELTQLQNGIREQKQEIEEFRERLQQ